MIEGCLCRQILGIDKPRIVPFGMSPEELEIFNRPRPLPMHLMGCPEDYMTKEYDTLPWYKKMFRMNPRRYYYYHLRP